jgi:hypothetical protein
VTVDYETATQNVRIVVKAAGDWLAANIGDPNRSATTWKCGEWCIEMSYSYAEGVLQIWRADGGPVRRLVTRGRNDADLQLWIDALEACRL